MSLDRTRRFETLAGGISIGSEEITAGTLTGRFIDLTDGREVIVSNRHVLEGVPGKTLVLQPGKYDGGKPSEDAVGKVKRLAKFDSDKPLPWWKKIICFLFGWILDEWCYPEKTPNRLDAGVATFEPTDLKRVLKGGVYMDDGSIIKVKYTVDGDEIVGAKVWKSGRTTGVTIGTVVDDKAPVQVWYGNVWRVFEDVVLVKGLARGGDSGSPVFLMLNQQPSEDDALCGILFAGSSEYWVHCKYKYLESILKVRWAP